MLFSLKIHELSTSNRYVRFRDGVLHYTHHQNVPHEPCIEYQGTIGPGTGLTFITFTRATTQHTLECPHERSKVCCDVARTFA